MTSFEQLCTSLPLDLKLRILHKVAVIKLREAQAIHIYREAVIATVENRLVGPGHR